MIDVCGAPADLWLLIAAVIVLVFAIAVAFEIDVGVGPTIADVAVPTAATAFVASRPPS